MVKIAHYFLAVTAVIWPASYVALLVSHKFAGLVATAGLLAFALFLIRYVKNVTHAALDAYYASEAQSQG